MRLVFTVIVSLAVTGLCACNDDIPSKRLTTTTIPMTTTTTPPAPQPPPTPITYAVPDFKCPVGWKGLILSPQTTSEIAYLDDMPACAPAGLNRTYLENGSEAVWVVKLSNPQSKATPLEETWQQVLFDEAVAPLLAAQTFALAPGAKIDIASPPAQVQWTLASDLTLAWHGQDLGIDKLQSLGGTAAVELARKKSPQRAALTTCTLSVAETAKAAAEVDKETKSTELLLSGLGVTVAGGKCYSASAQLQYRSSSGQVKTFSSELATVKTATSYLEAVHTQFGYALRGEKLLSAFKMCNFVPFC